MKKILVLAALIFVSLICSAQDPDYGLRTYASPYVHYSHGGVGMSVEMYFEDDLSTAFMTCASMGLYYSPVLDVACGTHFSYGVKYVGIRHMYAVFDLRPIVKLNGIGHQVYGDYLTFGVTSGVGIGGYMDIGQSSLLYAELKLCTDIIIYSEFGNKGGSYLYMGLGYRHRIL